MRLHVFGDSHSAYCFGRAREVILNWIGPLTAHRVGRDGADFVAPRLRDHRPGEPILFEFGEIDVRCHLVRRSYADIVSTAERYVGAIARVSPGPAYVMAPIPPIVRPRGTDFPFTGSFEERMRVHGEFTDAIKSAAVKFSVGFIPIPSIYLSPAGGLDFALSDGDVHMSPVETGALLDEVSKAVGIQLTALDAKVYRSISRLFPIRRVLKHIARRTLHAQPPNRHHSRPVAVAS